MAHRQIRPAGITFRRNIRAEVRVGHGPRTSAGSGAPGARTDQPTVTKEKPPTPLPFPVVAGFSGFPVAGSR